MRRAIDQSRATHCLFTDVFRPRKVWFFVKPHQDELQESTLTVRISSGLTRKGNLNRFRLSITDAGLQVPDIHRVATDLLEKVVARDLDDFWARVAISQSMARQSPPRVEAALRHATAAVALRPDHVAGHSAILRCLASMPMDKLKSDNPLGRLALNHAEVVREMEDQHAAIIELTERCLADAGWRESHDELDPTIAAYDFAQQVRPQSRDIRQQKERFWLRLLLEQRSTMMPLLTSKAGRSPTSHF